LATALLLNYFIVLFNNDAAVEAADITEFVCNF